MHRLLVALAVVTASAAAIAGDVGVTVRVGQPSFYGRIDIGDMPRPQVVYAQPIVAQPTQGVVAQPIYLRVPPGHVKHWSKHCQRYNACGQPVYFVQESWYNNVYVPRYRVAAEPAPMPPRAYVYQPRPEERLFVVPVASVRAVFGAPEQRCWVERQQVVGERSDALNVPGAIAGAVIGGVLGHQVGGGRGNDIATVGGAAAGAAIGANVGRGETRVYGEDVQRCATVDRHSRPEYWDVSYHFRGVVHRAQLSAPPGATITVDVRGQPHV